VSSIGGDDLAADGETLLFGGLEGRRWNFMMAASKESDKGNKK